MKTRVRQSRKNKIDIGLFREAFCMQMQQRNSTINFKKIPENSSITLYLKHLPRMILHSATNAFKTSALKCSTV